LRLIRSDLCGFEALLLPSASLHARAFSTLNEQEIVAAQAIVFPSPFSISASLRRCLELRERANCGSALLAVIGHGSYQALMNEISQLAWDPSQFEIVANTVEPFDAEHLAPKLRESLDALVVKQGRSAASPLNVVLLQGDKSNNDALVWGTWLNADAAYRPIRVSEIQAYENRENEVFEQLLAKTQPDTWCRQESVVYFSSSSTVRTFGKAVMGARLGLQETPTAITIHPKISKEVQKHLGWKVVEISVGPQALLNWLSQNSVPL
jgi:uroporphyrinogen-III synthase